MVIREPLIRRLDSIINSKLLVINAPTGAGKTSLISQWIAQTNLKTAWFSIDKNDNDSIRFWQYVMLALQSTGISLTNLEKTIHQTGHSVENRILLTKLINDITDAEHHIVLVFDDYHFVTNSTIHQELNFLVGNLPPNLHLIILSRNKLPFPLAHLRVRDQLIQLSGEDLRFSLQEIASFFQKVMQIDLSADQLHALEARTEGWIAGLQLVGLSLQRRTDIGQFIQKFRGNQDFVLEYLTEQVLNQQPAHVKAFLLQTAVLDKLCVPLCNAVTTQMDAQFILDYLNQCNLFIVSLDSEQYWHRYHHLFADLLYASLQHSSQYDEFALHQRASRWYEQNGFPVEAVDHALAGQDIDRAITLIHRAIRKLFSYGDFASLLSWMEQLPHHIVKSQPRFQISYAWGLVAVARLDEGEQELDYAETLLNSFFEVANISANEYNKLLGQIAAIRAFIARLRGQSMLSIQLSEQALEQSPDQHSLVRGLTALNLGISHFENYDFSAARLAFSDAVQINQTAGHIYISVTAWNNLGDIEYSRGYLFEAQRLYLKSIEVAHELQIQLQRPVPICGINYVRLGDVFYEWNDLDQAAKYYHQALQLAQHGGIVEILTRSYFGLARLAKARGDFHEALDLLDMAYDVVSITSATAHFIEVLTSRVEVLIAQDRLEVARFWLDKCQQFVSGNVSDSWNNIYVIQYIRLLNALKQYDEAIQVADDLVKKLRRGGLVSLEIKTLLLLCQSYQASGNTQKANSMLERALFLARAGQFKRSFLDEGQSIVELMYMLASRDVEVDYVEMLLAESNYPGEEPDIELSEREIDVLNLLEKGYSNRHIADKLFIAHSTVKVHTRRLYGKLSVTSREQAVARAKALKII